MSHRQYKFPQWNLIPGGNCLYNMDLHTHNICRITNLPLISGAAFKLTGAFHTINIITAGQYNVYVRKLGVVAFQSRQRPNRYLCIKEGRLTQGDGGSECTFKVKDNGGCMCG